MASTTAQPDLIGALKRIKTSLEHTRRFKLHPDDWRSAMVQAEGDIEELLIDYGFLVSDERDPDRKVFVHVDHQVEAGSGHNGPFRNRTYDQAKAIYDTESIVPSYMGQGMQKARLVRVTTIVEELERN